MTITTAYLIGAGRLGKAIAHALATDIQLLGVYNTHPASTQAAAQQLNAGTAINSLTELKPADLLFLGVPDDEIAPLVARLAEAQVLQAKTVVVHCSGILSSTILEPLALQGCYTASFHPLKAFTSKLVPKVFKGCYCALEGAPEAINTLSVLFKPLGANLIAIQPEKKALYHAAAVFTSNYLVTLAGAGISLFQEAGLDERQAQAISQQLMRSSLNNIENTENLTKALTGPLARGDINTIEKHLDELNENKLKQLYCTAALATLRYTSLKPEQEAAISDLLLNHHHGNIL